jgi:small subunit ribosomal protein S9
MNLSKPYIINLVFAYQIKNKKQIVSKRLLIKTDKGEFSMGKAIGRRKSSTAQVELVSGGTGKIIINGKEGTDYLQSNARSAWKIQAPLDLVGFEGEAALDSGGNGGSYDVIIRCSGGGLTGQAEAIQLGIARALCALQPSRRAVLKAEGFLTRNSLSKERKKYGLKKARKAPQFSKR